jgi:hypothetical protein
LSVPLQLSNIVGPLFSTTRSIASTTACHSASCCSAFGSFWIYLAASSRVTSWRSRGSGIGSSNGRFQSRPNGANPFCRTRSESPPAAGALRPFWARCISGGARRHHRRCRRVRLPTVDRDGSHTPSRNPRRESLSWLELTRTFASNLSYVRFGHSGGQPMVWLARRMLSGNVGPLPEVTLRIAPRPRPYETDIAAVSVNLVATSGRLA